MAARSATTPSIVATGAHHTFFGHDDWARYAQGLKTLEDAIEVRRRSSSHSRPRNGKPIRNGGARAAFVLVGGGPTGVELAGPSGRSPGHAQARLSRDRSPDAHIILVEAMDRVLFPPEGRSESAGASSSASASMSARP